MSKNSSAVEPDRPTYQETPYISGARNLSNMGYQNVANNLNRINVFDPLTQKSIQDNANAVYQRAEDDFARNYRDTMRNLDTRNYNRFGTLNATAPSYVRDMQNLQAQRQLMDSAYNKALYAEQLKDQELARRYNTLNFNNQLFNQYGNLYTDFDWRNQDIAYQNALKNFRYDQANRSNTNSWQDYATLGVNTLATILPFLI